MNGKGGTRESTSFSCSFEPTFCHDLQYGTPIVFMPTENKTQSLIV